MEINERMSKRFAWLLGVAVLVSIGFLVACGSKYNRSSDGLVLVGSWGSGLIETFGFSLASGRIAAINNPPSTTSTQTCVLGGLPSSIVVDPAGAYAYTIINANPSCSGSKNGLAAFKVNSDGTITAIGSLVQDPNPVAMVIDAAGKFLFVTEGVGGGVSAYSIGSGATLTAVPGTFKFTLPMGFQTPNFAALAATPTVFPKLGVNGVQNAVCSDAGNSPPTSEFLYVADSTNYVIWEFAVNTSTGALGNPGAFSTVPYFLTDAVPAGVAVDPCARFVYVSGSLNNRVSAYTICNGSLTQSPLNCPKTPDGSLVEVAGSPFSLTSSATGPGPLVVDPFGNSVYVLNTVSSGVSMLRISPITGTLTANATVVATGSQPKAIAVRGDDNWLFVANYGSATLSQYTITPATGVLSPLPAIQTDNYPWGVAVK
jgi:6-phosphogluconolactonase (cycloisomerase 2 family)